MEIHILLAGEQIGPFSEVQVRQYLGEGLVSSSDLAMYDGMPDWQSVDSVLSHLPLSEPAGPPDSVPESLEDADSISYERLIMHNNISETIESTSAPPPADPAPPLTATQKTKRKAGKIVIQPILPLEATAPIRKKPSTGKTAVTMEPLRPTTALPPITGPLPRERKPRQVRTGRVSLENLSEKITVPPAKELRVPPSMPSALANGSSPPPLLPPLVEEPATEIPAASIERRRMPREIVYAGAGLALLILGLILSLLYLRFTGHEASPANGADQPQSASPPPHQSDHQASETDPKTSADYTARGLARQSKGDVDEAIADYSQALELDPNNVQTFYRRGLARQAKGDWKGALSDYGTVIGLDPRNADAFSNRGFVKQAEGDADGALADYTQALLINPKIPAAFYNEGLIKVQKGNLDGAIAAYDHALDLDPKMAIAYYNRGNAKNTEGNLDGAIADYTQALGLNPKIALAYCNRGFARQTKGDPDGALADYAQALALNPKMVVAYYNRGLIKVEKGDLDGAIDDSTHAIDLSPNNGEAYCNRGLARLGKGNLDGAAADLKKFCALAPRDSGADSARLYLWVISMKKNPNGNADKDLSTLLQNDWNSPPEDLTSKIAAFLLGHIDEAALIANAASPDPSREPGQYCKVWYFAGIKRLLAGDSTIAINYFQKALATDEKDFCEYIFSQAELQTLGQSLPASAKSQ